MTTRGADSWVGRDIYKFATGVKAGFPDSKLAQVLLGHMTLDELLPAEAWVSVLARRAITVLVMS